MIPDSIITPDLRGSFGMREGGEEGYIDVEFDQLGDTWTEFEDDWQTVLIDREIAYRSRITFVSLIFYLMEIESSINRIIRVCMYTYVSFDERLEFSSIFRFNSEIRLQLSIMYIIIQQKCKYVYNYRTSVTSVLRIVDCLLRKTLVVSEIENWNFKDESPRRNFYAENTFFPYL